MAPIARIAKVRLPDTPELAALRMPRGRPTILGLAAHAEGMAAAAAPFTDVFVAAGLPADFIVQLHTAVDAMLEPVNVRKQTRSR